MQRSTPHILWALCTRRTQAGIAMSESAARVLFVNDDEATCASFSPIAEAIGVEVAFAGSGGRAIELVQSQPFSVAVVDHRMPNIGGAALLERLSAMNRAMAFVLLSADHETDSCLRGEIDGAIASLLGLPLEFVEARDAIHRAYQLHVRRAARLRRSAESSAWTLLVIEDSEQDTELLREYLAAVPELDVTYVGRLRDAIQLLHDRAFDSILTDLSLADARGFDALIRLQTSAPDSAVVVHSGVEDEILAQQIIQLGAQDYLPKRTTDSAALLRALRFARERKRSEIKLRRLAHRDQLTGLANRAHFHEALSCALARAQRLGARIAVMMIDLDGFKAVNDTLGHEAGDLLLQEVGARLRKLFREYDVVARLGGDEFAVLITDFPREEALVAIAERLSVALRVAVPDAPAEVSGSIGVAVYPEGGATPERLMRAADGAMYESKRAGRSGYVFARRAGASSSNPAAAQSVLPGALGHAHLAPPRVPDDLCAPSEVAAGATRPSCRGSTPAPSYARRAP